MNANPDDGMPAVGRAGQMHKASAAWRRYCIAAVGTCVARMQRAVEQLQSPGLSDAGRVELLDRVALQTRELNALMRQVLGGDTTSLTEMPQAYSLRTLIAGVVGQYIRLNSQHRFRLDVSGQAQVSAALMPCLQIVLEMLLDNALRCAPSDTDIVVAAYEETGADRVTVRISDAGVGIAPDRLATVLDDPSGAAPASLYGLGITFARQLVEALGGRMWVESEFGHGASFCFCLARPALRRRFMVSRPKVLVIDDDTELRASLKTNFEEAGFEVQVADSNEHGLAAAQAFGPQVVVLELAAAVPSDSDTFVLIQQQTNAAVICLSSAEDRKAIADALWLGAADCLSKPFHVRELIARTRAILRRRGGRGRVEHSLPLYHLTRLNLPPRVDPLLQ
jgi:ActR/RegA family two-component response regulator